MRYSAWSEEKAAITAEQVTVEQVQAHVCHLWRLGQDMLAQGRQEMSAGVFILDEPAAEERPNVFFQGLFDLKARCFLLEYHTLSEPVVRLHLDFLIGEDAALEIARLWFEDRAEFEALPWSPFTLDDWNVADFAPKKAKRRKAPKGEPWAVTEARITALLRQSREESRGMERPKDPNSYEQKKAAVLKRVAQEQREAVERNAKSK